MVKSLNFAYENAGVLNNHVDALRALNERVTGLSGVNNDTEQLDCAFAVDDVFNGLRSYIDPMGQLEDLDPSVDISALGAFENNSFVGTSTGAEGEENVVNLKNMLANNLDLKKDGESFDQLNGEDIFQKLHSSVFESDDFVGGFTAHEHTTLNTVLDGHTFTGDLGTHIGTGEVAVEKKTANTERIYSDGTEPTETEKGLLQTEVAFTLLSGEEMTKTILSQTIDEQVDLEISVGDTDTVGINSNGKFKGINNARQGVKFDWDGTACITENRTFSGKSLNIPNNLPFRVCAEVTIRGGKMSVKPGARVEIAPGGSIVVESTASVIIEKGATVITYAKEGDKNEGKITIRGKIHHVGTINNYGSIVNDAYSEFENHNTINNYGTILNTTKFKFINEGIINNKNNGTLSNSGEFNNDYYYIINNDGKIINNEGGTITHKKTGVIVDNERKLKPKGIYNNEGGTITNNSTIENKDFFTNNGTIENKNIFINDSWIINNNNGTINNVGTFRNDYLIRNDGTINNVGTFRNDYLIRNDGTITNDGTINNVGTIYSVNDINGIVNGNPPITNGDDDGDDDGDGTRIISNYDLSGIEIAVGSKDFDEQLILGEILALAFEAAGATVVNKVNLGGTGAVRKALLSGDIDIYPEYNGTGWTVHLGMENPSFDPEELISAVREKDLEQNDIMWVGRSPFSNTYGFASSPEVTDVNGGPYSLQTMMEYVDANPDAIVCMDSEFPNRNDGLILTEDVTGIELPDEQQVILDAGIIYNELRSNKCDFGQVFTTDGRIPALDLTLVKDPGVYPVFNVSGTMRGEKYDEAPKAFDGIIELVLAPLDNERMARLNARVSSEGEDPEAVARDYLSLEGLID